MYWFYELNKYFNTHIILTCINKICVCVCVIYVYLTLNILHTIPVVGYLRLPGPFAIPAILRIRRLPCYTPIIFPHRVRVFDLIYYRHSRQHPLDLATPGQDQCHHRPIRQLWSLPDARPFVARDVEEQAVRPHYF